MSGFDPVGSFPVGADGDDDGTANTFYPVSITSAETWGTLSFTVYLEPSSIDSAEAWGTTGWLAPNITYLPASVLE